MGASTYAVVQLQKQEAIDAKREFDEYKLTVEGKVADAKLEGIKASENASNAQLRATELEKETALAKLQTEPIKQVVAWRTLSPKEAAELKRVLETSPGRVNLRYTGGDPESLFFAIQLSKILRQANWQVGSGAESANSIVFGVNLPDPPSPEMNVLRNAFASAGLPFSTQPPPNTGTSAAFNLSIIPGAPILRVGPKEPPAFPQ